MAKSASSKNVFFFIFLHLSFFNP